MERFDTVITVDWSAASTPTLGRDSIWVAVTPDDVVMNIATRHRAEQVIERLIHDRPGQRVLVGVDASFGYPAGTAAALNLDGRCPPWRAMWELLGDLIVDEADNRNNRFEVAATLNERMGVRRFWGAPPSAAGVWLTATKPPLDREFRAVELAYRARGLRPASSWQLLGVGSVGSQSLTAIPVLLRLRRSAEERVRVWPFEPSSGAVDEVLFAEVWPSEIDRAVVNAVEHPVADARQVIALGRALHDGIDPGKPGAGATSEEGWVLSTIGV
jgi:hypothetical protein